MATTAFQLERTKALRLAAYRMGRLSSRRRVLEVGAGEGAVTAEIAARTGRSTWGLDIVLPKKQRGGVSFVRGDGAKLPFKDGSFDAVAFHFVLLWLRDPVGALREARRVVSDRGVLLLLAEPDMTARRDEPDTGLGKAICDAVERKGGHPDSGIRAEEWLEEAGFRPELHTTPPEWASVLDPEETLAEARELLLDGAIGEAEAEAMMKRERRAARRRVLLPVTYGAGWPS